jgi:hypothetical protein
MREAVEVVDPIFKFFSFFVAFTVVAIVVRLWWSPQKAIRSVALAWYMLELEVEG